MAGADGSESSASGILTQKAAEEKEQKSLSGPWEDTTRIAIADPAPFRFSFRFLEQEATEETETLPHCFLRCLLFNFFERAEFCPHDVGLQSVSSTLSAVTSDYRS